MRGGPGPVGRGGPPHMAGNEATGRAIAHPAPYGGWNARGNLANMRPEEALQMDNIVPGVNNVEIRNGCISWATASPATIRSLMAYSGLVLDKLFAATAAGIYNITASGAIGAAAVACTGGEWDSLNFATAGGNFLFAVNGADSAKTFDGTNWAVPAITVATSSTWSQVTAHKKRIWAVEKQTMKLWYLPVDSIAGAATVFPVGSLFKKGGYVVSVGTWTMDGGSGIDDLFVIATSKGEIAIYQGTDPASSTTWALVGVYDVPAPIGKKPFFTFGGDLLYLSASGLIPLSKLSTILDRSTQVSYDIDGAFLDAATDYAGNLGWQVISHRAANLLMVNVPVSQDTLSYQFVMNTVTKKWCRFTGWNASCWANHNGKIYFASDKTVFQAWTGTTDAGTPITAVVAQAYASIGLRSQKQITLCRPNIGLSGSAQITLALDADYRAFAGQTTFAYTPAATGAIWDTSVWGTGLWDGGSSLFERRWFTVPGELGYLHSFRLQLVASSGNFVWTSTDFVVRGAGIL